METTNIQQGMENTVQQGQEQNTSQQETKTFSQEDLNKAIEKRLERERKKYPSQEELEQFKSWKESQQSQEEKWANLQKERNSFESQLHSTKSELEQLKRERYLLTKGVSINDVDYYVFKISKSMTDNDDFETVAERYLKENQQSQNTIVNFGMNTNNGSQPLSLGEQINRRLRGE